MRIVYLVDMEMLEKRVGESKSQIISEDYHMVLENLERLGSYVSREFNLDSLQIELPGIYDGQDPLKVISGCVKEYREHTREFIGRYELKDVLLGNEAITSRKVDINYIS
ncbi:MAG: hypothetical protein ACI83O_000317 [Patescibacteria group bacterium]